MSYSFWTARLSSAVPSHRTRTILATAVALAAVTIGIGAGDAQAVAGYHTSAASVRVRAGASTSTAQISVVATAGTAIDIACQVSGQSVTASGFGTSPVWDRLNGFGNGYISDLFVQETPYAQFDGRIPRCDAPPAAPAPTYTISQTAALHSAPSINAATIQSSIAAGTAISIQCQNYGTRNGGSFVWDRIAGGWVSDVFVNGTPFNAFDTRLPRCGEGYQPVDCSKALFLGARGSGEPLGGEQLGGAGTPVQETRNRLVAAYGANIDVAGTIYPAQNVNILLGGDVTGYLDGEKAGVSVMLNNLRARTNGNVCGWQNTKTLLVGYSQGAMVVSDAIFAMTPQERSTILGVVTYGNPHFTPFVNGATITTGGTAPNIPAGIAGPRGSYPDGVSSRSQDYCRRDIVCTVGGSIAQHLSYVSPGPDVSRGALFLANRLGINP